MKEYLEELRNKVNALRKQDEKISSQLSCLYTVIDQLDSGKANSLTESEIEALKTTVKIILE